MSEIIVPNQTVQRNVVQNLYAVTSFLPSSWNAAGVIATFPLFINLQQAQLFANQNNADVVIIQVPSELLQRLEDNFNSSKPVESAAAVSEPQEVNDEVSDSTRSSE